jgi:multicomponent K+:H+ antiporter subunit D
LSHFVTPIIWPLAIASIVVGSVGVIVNPTLRGLAGNLVIVSVGTLLLGFALRTPEASAAAFFYMIHSTIASAILFLLAEMIGQQRGKAQDRFVISRKLKNQRFLGFCFFIAAMMAAGLPPFSGFLGKLVILQSAVTLDEKIWVYSALLISSLITIIAFSRAGTTIFWRHAGNKDVSDSPDVTLWQKMGLLVLLVAGPALALGGQYMLALTNIAALELHNVSGLIELMGVGGLK